MTELPWVPPWVDWADAKERLLDAVRRRADVPDGQPADDLALLEWKQAADDIALARLQTAFLFDFLLGVARSEDGINDRVRNRLNSFGLEDQEARVWLGEVADRIVQAERWLARVGDELRSVRENQAEIVDRIQQLEDRLEGSGDGQGQARRNLRAAAC